MISPNLYLTHKLIVKKFSEHISPLMRLSFATGLAVCSAIAHGADKTLEEAHKALQSDKSYVFDYAVRDVPQTRPRQTSRSGSFDGIDELFTVLFWVAVAIAVGILLYFVISEIVRLNNIERGPKQQDVVKPEIIPNYQPEVQAAKSLLGDVDELAAQGRYEEAIHTLLLRSISDIRANRPKAVPKAMTSREISHISILSELARQAFRNIGDRVERSYFGGRTLSKDDFERSRADYETFAFERKQTS